MQILHPRSTEWTPVCARDMLLLANPRPTRPPVRGEDGSFPIPLADPRAGDPIIDPLSHTNFPYSVASVCTQWRDIVLTEPIFWASPIITVGAYRPLFEPTSQSHFELSRDYFLDIKIVCREELSASQPSSEQADVMALLPYIHKVFHRCNSISFHLNRSSSLPSLARHFGTIAWSLEHVELRCKIDDGRNTLPAPCHTQKGFSNTWSLVVDGHNFKDLIKYPGERGGLRRLSLLSDIVISGYSASASERDPLSLYDMLKALEDVGIMRLTLQNIDLDLAVPATVSKPNLHLMGMRAVSFEDLSGDLIDAVFEFIPNLYANARITRCSLPRSKIRTRRLTLEAINKEENLHSFLLSRWRGHALSVKDCPQFNDTLLRELSHKGRDGQWICLAMDALDISGCRDFSVLALRELLEARIQAAPEFEMPWMSISHGTVRSCRDVSVKAGPFLDEENRKWFEATIQKFTWCD